MEWYRLPPPCLVRKRPSVEACILTAGRQPIGGVAKACHWLEKARRDGVDLSKLIESAQAATGSQGTERAKAVAESLLRNRTILERLGCLDEEGMAKLRTGKAPTVTKGPYKGELATGDHIIPRSVCPELSNTLYNLEFLPETLNQKKSAKIGDRQVQLGRKWNAVGLLSDEGLAAVNARFKE